MLYIYKHQKAFHFSFKTLTECQPAGHQVLLKILILSDKIFPSKMLTFLIVCGNGNFDIDFNVKTIKNTVELYYLNSEAVRSLNTKP